MTEYLYLVSEEGIPLKRRAVFTAEPQLPAFLTRLEECLLAQKELPCSMHEYFVEIWDSDFEEFIVLEEMKQVATKGKIHLRPKVFIPHTLHKPSTCTLLNQYLLVEGLKFSCFPLYFAPLYAQLSSERRAFNKWRGRPSVNLVSVVSCSLGWGNPPLQNFCCAQRALFFTRGVLPWGRTSRPTSATFGERACPIEAIAVSKRCQKL